MGTIDSRLNKVINATREGFRIPIIVETVNVPSSSDVQELRGFMSVSRVSNLVNQVYGSADSYGVQNVARLGFVSKVYYDEPIYKFQLPSISISEKDIFIPTTCVSKYVGAKETNDEGYTGKGIKIAVIDTGVNRKHPMLYNAVTKSINIAKKNGAENAKDGDGQGHGTHVASIAAGRPVDIDSKIMKKSVKLTGMSPEAEIISIKVLDDEGSGQTSWVTEGIETAVQEGADVLNLSLGSLWDGAGQSPDSKIINEITFRYGKICCVAAGNSFINFSIGSPGGAVGAITVSSNAVKVPTDGIVSSFSSKGFTSDGRVKPDISAPGGNLFPLIKEVIYSATSGILAEEAGEDYIGMMGSSMATPVVSGVIALLLEAGLKRDRFYIEDLLAVTSKHQRVKDIYSGWGIINAQKALTKVLSKEQLFPVSSIMRFSEKINASVPFPAVFSDSAMESRIRLPYIK